MTTDKVHLMAHLAIDKGLNAQEVDVEIDCHIFLHMMKIVGLIISCDLIL